MEDAKAAAETNLDPRSSSERYPEEGKTSLLKEHVKAQSFVVSDLIGQPRD